MNQNGVKTRITLRITQKLDHLLTIQAQNLGISKNAFIALKLAEAAHHGQSAIGEIKSFDETDLVEMY